MTVISMRCTSCGSDIQIDNSRPFGFCMYCGNKVQIDVEPEKPVEKPKVQLPPEIQALVDKAEAGNLESQYELGSRYFTGKGVCQDYHESFKWYKMAADQGDPFAMYSLSIMYSGGLGVHQSCTWGNYWGNEAIKHGINERCRKPKQ